MQTRRMFVQAGAALAVPAIGGLLLTRERGIAAAACTTCADDPVSAEAMRQFKMAIRALKKSRKGEHARQAASALRVMAVNGRARNLDAELRRAAERELNTYGRDNVLMRPLDQDQFAATARELGIDPAPELRAVPLAERRQALDVLLAGGITGYVDRAAALFEAAGARLDARAPLQQVQTTKEEQIAFCRNLQTAIFAAEATMIVACILWGPIACGLASGLYLGLRYSYEVERECSRWVG